MFGFKLISPAVAMVCLIGCNTEAEREEHKPFEGSFEPEYLESLEGRLEVRKEEGPREFASALGSASGICLIEVLGEGNCTGDNEVRGFDVVFSQCSTIQEGKGYYDAYSLCENLIRRQSDGKQMACARIMGWFPGHHAPYRSAEVRMHVAEDGSWKSGPSPEEKAETERQNAEFERRLKAGENVPPSMPPNYSNLQCTTDPKEFFKV